MLSYAGIKQGFRGPRFPKPEHIPQVFDTKNVCSILLTADYEHSLHHTRLAPRPQRKNHSPGNTVHPTNHVKLFSLHKMAH